MENFDHPPRSLPLSHFNFPWYRWRGGPLRFSGCRSKNTVVSNLEVATIVSWALTMSILGESWTPHDWVNLKLGDEKNRDHFSIFPEKWLPGIFWGFWGCIWVWRSWRVRSLTATKENSTPNRSWLKDDFFPFVGVVTFMRGEFFWRADAAWKFLLEKILKTPLGMGEQDTLYP